MSFLGEPFPESMNIDGHQYKINTDFRIMLRIEKLLQEENENKAEKVFQLFYGELPKDIEKATEQFLWFYRCGKPEKQAEKGKGETAKRIYSFEYDGEYIFAAFLDQYSIDLVEIETLHWWKFRALFEALKPDHVFCEIRKCRSIQITNDMTKSQREYYRAMKKLHALPVSQTEQEYMDAITAALLGDGNVSEVL